MLWEQLLTLEDIKKEPYYIQNILWDFDPLKLLEPHMKIEEDKIVHERLPKGFIFYIETVGDKPELFLMRIKANYFVDTIAKIEEIPTDMLFEALEENKERVKFGICPINEKIKEWLKKQFGLD